MLRPLYYIFLCLTLTGTLPAQNFTVSDRTESAVDSLLSMMTLSEKIGQMTQLTFNAVALTDEDGDVTPPGMLDPVKLETVIAERLVGSILNVPIHAFTTNEWHGIIAQIQDVAVNKTRMAIPVIYGIDAIHGASYTMGATLFPQSINLAATWNPDYAEESARITADEIYASGIRWNFNPVLDIGRQPLWPRHWETFGEDPYLAAEMGIRYVRGLQTPSQGDDLYVAACLKHYAGYGYPWSGMDRTPAIIDQRTMNDWQLPSFEAAIRAGAATVMGNSSEVNGIPGHANYELITEILKEQWEFQGFFVSDWRDIINLHSRDRVARTPKDAVCMAVNAGVDMSMVPYDFSFIDYLQTCVLEGSVPMERVDDAVRRILRVKFAIGLFENPYPDRALAGTVGTEASKHRNLAIAQESIVLAKNDGGILPLDRNTKILVSGPTANLKSALNGGWTITWQGDNEALYPDDALTLFEALRDALTMPELITYVEGVAFRPASGESLAGSTAIDIGKAQEAAREADVIILALGEPAYCEGRGNIMDLTIDDPQIKLAQAMIETGKPVILVLLQGRPRIISRFVDKVQAVLIAGLPGMEGGRAIADILYGEANPSAKLPYSYPRYPNALTPYDHKPLEASTYHPQWEFGHGLSYTKFSYDQLRLHRNSISPDEILEVSVRVTNTGPRKGKEVVQVYVTDLFGTVSRPVRQLQRFRIVELESGESELVEFRLSPSDLEFTGLDNIRILEQGEFEITVGSLKERFEITD